MHSRLLVLLTSLALYGCSSSSPETPLVCGDGVADCDGSAGNGCETDLTAVLCSRARAALPLTDCVPSQGPWDVVIAEVTACTTAGCPGAVGCPMTLSWDSVSFDPGGALTVTGSLSIPLAIDVAWTIGGSSNCILTLTADLTYAGIAVASYGPGTEGIAVDTLGTTMTNTQTSGCGAELGDIAGSVVALVETSVASQAATLTPDVITAIEATSGDCG